MFNRYFSTIRKFPLTVTDNAWNKMNEIILKNKSIGFLFSASSGGCNGFNYKLSLLDDKLYNEIKDTNSIFNSLKNKDTTLYIDPIAEMLLMGTTIDYIKEDYNKGIFENKFTFTPDKKMATSCGCGVSFSPRNN